MNELELSLFSNQLSSIAQQVLTEREYDILMSRALHNITFKQLGKEYNISPSRIGQIEAKAHRKLLNKIRMSTTLIHKGSMLVRSQEQL